MPQRNSDRHNGTAHNTGEGVVGLHLEWMNVRNLSPLTIKARRTALARLAVWLDGPVLYADAATLSRWQTDRARTLAPATRRTELSMVREFYRWAVLEGLITTDPTSRLPMPKAPQGRPRPIRDDRLARAISGADPEMAVILGLAAFAGLRAVEVARLDWSEVSLDAKPPMLTVVHGKGGRSRPLPLSPVLVAMLEALPARHGPVVRRADGGGGATSANSVTKRASAWLHSNGIDDTLHCLRHRFGTMAYRANRDIRATQELLGHASPTTTAVYAQAEDAAVVDAVLHAGHLVA